MSQPRLLGGRYELDQVIGRGGMAEVYRARDLRLDRLVAVKTLRSDLARDHIFQERFRREAQSAASLNHPSIIAVYDTGEDMIDGVSIPYIIMEYVDGRTLKELLDDDRRLLPERTVELVDGILRALDYSHRNGIVHRDIKPANIMLTKQAEVKVMDFGIARAMNDSQATMTQTSQVIGTAQYLSPEQARGERVDARSDIYSTGCVLYELLTGRPPFTGDSPVSIAYQHVREHPVPPSELDPEIPEWIEEIVFRAMTKDREERYQSAAEMRADIQRGMQGMPTEAGTMAMGAAGSTTMLPPTQNRRDEYDDDYEYDDEDDRRGDTRKKALLALLALAVLGSFVFIGWLFLRGGAEAITVPDLSGETVEQARTELTDAGFTNVAQDTKEQASEDVEEGLVVGTDPPSGQSISEGTSITIVVSSGTGQTDVPNIQGMTKDQAESALNNAGLKLGSTSEREDGSAPEGTVLESDPAIDSTVETGTSVNVVLAKAVSQVKVPNLSGLNEDQARSRLEELGLGLNPQQEEAAGTTPGTAIRQDPGADAMVDPGSEVTVVFAIEPQQPSESPESDPPESDPPPDGGEGSPEDGFPSWFPWEDGRDN
ncbi:Stk1 family PASTA domain-containing Ser/Thr kinase [Nocardiopsis ansamitocini]|uniref:non-specific serine/threonine protein kinase n=1 Tax=Nocardiopsis ansamitocini TaxID=1670832 RepID=A0A9W6UIF1_9ACTN|nr:Stk1 family PASTA domain-containing Ser/Thr kinase [Nocardiopsis ansamitocini]GLU49876.1 putative serine/threonine-protein kinase [Nocardiopsis ansamitocini]